MSRALRAARTSSSGPKSKVAVATLVNTRGTTPRKEGAKMLVGEGGRVLGSVTIGGCVDAQVIEESADVLGKNAPRLLELNLGDEEAWEIGLTCGGHHRGLRGAGGARRARTTRRSSSTSGARATPSRAGGP